MRHFIPIDLSENDIRRFWSKVDQSQECWLWRGSITPYGYGTLKVKNRNLMAHRVSFFIHYGELHSYPLVVDHICRNTACVNPAHLREITNKENILISTSSFAMKAQQTTCHKGHPFDEQNTYIKPNGGRGCRVCNRESVRAYKARKKGMA